MLQIKSTLFIKKTEWSSKKHKNDNQETVFYNYQIDGKDVFDRWLEKDIFLYELIRRMVLIIWILVRFQVRHLFRKKLCIVT